MDFDKTMSFKVERDNNLEAKEIMKHPENYKSYNDIYEMMEEIENEW